MVPAPTTTETTTTAGAAGRYQPVAYRRVDRPDCAADPVWCVRCDSGYHRSREELDHHDNLGSYDDAGYLCRTTDNLGRITQTSFDALGRVGVNFQTTARGVIFGASVDPRDHSGSFGLTSRF